MWTNNGHNFIAEVNYLGNYCLKGQEGSIDIRDIETFEDKLTCSNNTLMWLQVKSGPFAGGARIDVCLEELREFSLNLKNMYECLSGEAFIKEVYGESYLSFTSMKGGHIKVSGILEDCDSNQKLDFDFIIDQTMLRDFAYDMYKEYALLSV